MFYTWPSVYFIHTNLSYTDSDEEVVEDGGDDGGDTTWAIPTTRGEGHRGNKVEKT
jgi:hypothetical protein